MDWKALVWSKNSCGPAEIVMKHSGESFVTANEVTVSVSFPVLGEYDFSDEKLLGSFGIQPPKLAG